MAFIIKLFYGDEIRSEINSGGHHVNTDATKLDATVDTIFNQNHWEPDCWTSSKKAAIKDILKDVLVEQRAKDFPALIKLAQTTMLSHKIALPLTPADADLLCQKLHESNPIFSPKEIHYLLRNYSAIGQLYIDNGLMDVDDMDRLVQIKNPDAQCLEQSFKKIHKFAQEDHKYKKEYFHELTAMISDKTGISEADIHREIYTSIFNVAPIGLSDKEVIKQVQFAAPEFRLKAYRKMAGFIRLTEMTQSLSKKDVAAFKEISRGKVPQNLDGHTLDRFSFLLDHLSMLREGPVNNPFYNQMEAQLKQAWNAKFGNDAPIGKVLSSYNDPNDEQRLDFRNFSNAFDTLKDRFNSTAEKWIKARLTSANKLNSSVSEIFRFIHKKFNFYSVTPQHIFKALNVNQLGVPNVTNLNELLPLLFTISTSSAQKILALLKDPSSDHHLTFHEQKHLLLLYSFAKGLGGSGTRVTNEDINFDLLKKYLPHRGKSGTAIDEEIISQLYARCDDTDLFFNLYQNAVITGFRSYTARAKPEAIDRLVQSDITATALSLNGLDLPDGSFLKMTEAFRVENHRNPDIVIKLPGELKPVVIPSYSEESPDEVPVLLGQDEHVLTIHQAIGHYLHLFAKGDETLSLTLQTLCSQTVFNHLYFTATTRQLNNLLHLPETDTSINRLMVAPNVSSRSIQYVSDTKIRIEYYATLVFRDTTQDPLIERSVPLILMLDLEYDQGAWTVRNPTFMIDNETIAQPQHQIVVESDGDEISLEGMLNLEPMRKSDEEPSIVLKVATREQLNRLIEIREIIAKLPESEEKQMNELAAEYDHLILDVMGSDFFNLRNDVVGEVLEETARIGSQEFDRTGQIAIFEDQELLALYRIAKDPNIHFSDDLLNF